MSNVIFAGAFDGGSPTGNSGTIDLEYNDIDILQGALFADVVIDYCYDFRVQNTMTDYTACISQTVRFKNPCVDTDYV